MNTRILLLPLLWMAVAEVTFNFSLPEANTPPLVKGDKPPAPLSEIILVIGQDKFADTDKWGGKRALSWSFDPIRPAPRCFSSMASGWAISPRLSPAKRDAS